LKIRWTQSSRRHRIGRARALHLMANTVGHTATTDRGDRAVLWVGVDDRGIELEVVAVLHPEQLLVIHVMPTALRRNA